MKRYNIQDEVEKHEQFYSNAKENFLNAWKKGINSVGHEFFEITSDSADEATDKWQLKPNMVFIQEVLGGYSHGRQVLLGIMCSFFNPKDGQKLLEQTMPIRFAPKEDSTDYLASA